MPRREFSKKTKPDVTTDSLLEDIGFEAAQVLEIKVKSEIYRELLRHIQELALTQRELGVRLAIHQPDVSNLLTGRVSRFSVGKLIKFAGRLNLSAQIRLTAQAPARTASGLPSRDVGRRTAAAA
jgi:predicted XRE-type DNA-binding protein